MVRDNNTTLSYCCYSTLRVERLVDCPAERERTRDTVTTKCRVVSKLTAHANCSAAVARHHHQFLSYRHPFPSFLFWAMVGAVRYRYGLKKYSSGYALLFFFFVSFSFSLGRTVVCTRKGNIIMAISPDCWWWRHVPLEYDVTLIKKNKKIRNCMCNIQILKSRKTSSDPIKMCIKFRF